MQKETPITNIDGSKNMTPPLTRLKGPPSKQVRTFKVPLYIRSSSPSIVDK